MAYVFVLLLYEGHVPVVEYPADGYAEAGRWMIFSDVGCTNHTNRYDEQAFPWSCHPASYKAKT